MYPLKNVSCVWTSKLAYIIGLLATDGCLSKDGRHIDFTSKDLCLVEIFKNYLGLKNKIGKKVRGDEKEKRYFHIQFGDVNFYRFLNSVGLFSAKSKTIGPLRIKNGYFFDFLRGCIDGDGNIRTFRHPESQHLQLRVRIISASRKFLEWLQGGTKHYSIKGFMMQVQRAYVLEYAMRDSINLLNKVYYKNFPASLRRKFVIAESFLRT
jgi:hypothetical protein